MSEYIDREAAINAVFGAFADGRSTYIALEAIPAADVRPVVKGRWSDHRTLEHDGDWYCTACGKEVTIYMGPDREDRYRYCPNCGAEMPQEGEA